LLAGNVYFISKYFGLQKEMEVKGVLFVDLVGGLVELLL